MGPLEGLTHSCVTCHTAAERFVTVPIGGSLPDPIRHPLVPRCLQLTRRHVYHHVPTLLPHVRSATRGQHSDTSAARNSLLARSTDTVRFPAFLVTLHVR